MEEMLEKMNEVIERRNQIYEMIAHLERSGIADNEEMKQSLINQRDELNSQIKKMEEEIWISAGVIKEPEEIEPFEITNNEGQKFLIQPLENDVSFMSKYKMTPMINGKYDTSKEETIYMNSPIEIDKINDDKEYAEAIKDFFNSDRINGRKEEAQKFNSKSLYMGNLHREDNGYYQKQRIQGNKLYHVYNKMNEAEENKRILDYRLHELNHLR